MSLDIGGSNPVNQVIFQFQNIIEKKRKSICVWKNWRIKITFNFFLEREVLASLFLCLFFSLICIKIPSSNWQSGQLKTYSKKIVWQLKSCAWWGNLIVLICGWMLESTFNFTILRFRKRLFLSKWIFHTISRFRSVN